jgi:hypothetical protein
MQSDEYPKVTTCCNLVALPLLPAHPNSSIFQYVVYLLELIVSEQLNCSHDNNLNSRFVWTHCYLPTSRIEYIDVAFI